MKVVPKNEILQLNTYGSPLEFIFIVIADCARKFINATLWPKMENVRKGKEGMGVTSR
jgi:hypothetical protein